MSGRQEQRQATEAEAERLKRARLVMIGKAIQFGSTVVGSLAIFFGGGIFLDRQLGTSPLLLLIGLLLAFIAIGYNLYDLATFGVKKRGAVPVTKPAGTATGAKRKSWDDWDKEERDDKEAE